MKRYKNARGFTLVEIVVVIGIIAVLSSIVMANLGTAKAKSRDAKRITELAQIELALEVYKQAYGRYPAAGCSRGTSWTGHGSDATYGGSCAQYIAGLSNILTLPVDSGTTVYGYTYKTDASGTEYKLMAYNVMETKSVGAVGDQYSRYPASCSLTLSAQDAKTYALYQDTSPNGTTGAECW